MIKNKLIGKMYPVKNAQGEKVGEKEITNVVILENVNGVVIFFGNIESGIEIGMKEAREIANND